MSPADPGNRAGPWDVPQDMTRPRRVCILLGACLLALSGCASPEGTASASCATQLRYDGAVYEAAPKGPPDRAPELTGRTDTAEVPGCEDTGGEDPPPSQVEVEEIAGVPMTTAVWSMDGVLVRRGATLPASSEAWYGVPGCSLGGPVDLVGTWVGVSSEKKVRFDGDLRTPLRIDLYVEPGSGNPDELERYTLRVHDDGAASPALDRHLAEEALWSTRAALAVTVVCDGNRYQARSFALVPRD